jgi:hypothetical protein
MFLEQRLRLRLRLKASSVERGASSVERRAWSVERGASSVDLQSSIRGGGICTPVSST